MGDYSNSFLSSETKESLRPVIALMKDYSLFLLKWSFIPILLMGLFGYYFRKQQASKPEEYTATIKFIESSKLNSGLPTLPSFGGGGGSGGSTSEILNSIIISDAVLSHALFSKLPEEVGEDQLLINKYIQVYEIKFGEKPVIYTSDVLSTNEQRAIFKRIINQLTRSDSEIFNFSTSDVHSISARTPNENLTYSLAINIYNSLVNFYEQNKIENSDESLKTLVAKRDSTRAVLRLLEGQAAMSEQKSGFKKTQLEALPSIDLSRDIDIARKEYLNYYSQVEKLKLNLEQGSNTFFRQLNYPIFPLSKTKNKLMFQTILGAGIGLVLGIFLISLFFIIRFLRQLYKSIYTE